MIKAVLFDLDGLIVDCDLMNYSVYKGVMAKLGYDFKVVDYVQNYLGKTDMKIAEMLIDKYYLPYEVKDFLKESFLVESKLLKEGVKLKKGVKELLTYLKENNFKIALASLSSENRTRNILKHHKIDTYFDCFTFGHEVAKGKPNPEIFKKTCAKLNEKPIEEKPQFILPYKEGKVVVDYFDGKTSEIISVVEFEGVYRPSQGVDISNNGESFDVLSGTDGVVLNVTNDPLLGNGIQVQSGEYIITYQSLDKITLKKGEPIKQGMVIGTAGSNIYQASLKNHLHLVVEKNQQRIKKGKT